MLKNKKFLLLFSATFFSSFGDATLFVILLSMLQSLGGSGVSTSFYFIFSAVPVLLFGLHIGAFVENKSLQKVMIYSDITRILFLLIFYLYNLLFTQTIFTIYLLIFFVTFINIFFTTASSTLMPHIVEHSNIPKANSLFRIITMIAKLLSYSFAALLFYLNVGSNEGLIIVTVFYVISFVAISFIRPSFRNRQLSTENPPFMYSIKEGLSYIKNDKVIFRLFIVFGLGWMAGASIDLYLINYLKLVLNKGAENLYLFTTPTFIGIIIGSLISPYLYKNMNKKYGLLLSLFAFSLAILCFALEWPLLLLQCLLVIGGISQGILNIFVVSYLQTHVESTHLARVFSVYNMICIGGGIPGYLLFGYLIDTIGVLTLGFIISSYLFIVGIVCVTILPALDKK
ncbi:MFS transporter [Solibacillus sp. FSL H8-0523]|uniref:MFS transporter n=1 Tax=Solibacillus sp. FSL H8-0523 TaxID=2954511 RepID=UPI0031011AD9